MFYMLQYVGQKPASWREAAGHTVQIYQDISDLLLSHFSSWLSFNKDWSEMKRTMLGVGQCTAISGHFFDNYINNFHKTEDSMVISRCPTYWNLN